MVPEYLQNTDISSKTIPINPCSSIQTRKAYGKEMYIQDDELMYIQMVSPPFLSPNPENMNDCERHAVFHQATQ